MSGNPGSIHGGRISIATVAPRILILRGGALGDFILTLPAIRALRRQWPSAHIEVIGHPEIAGLAVAAGFVDTVRSLDASAMAAWFVPHRAWPERERSDIASFDLILSYLSDADGVVQANLRAAGAKRVMACSPAVPSGHAADHFLRPVLELCLAADGEPLLPWPEALKAQGRDELKKLGLTGAVVSLHPGSGSSRKNWPVERFVQLAEAIRRSLAAQPLFLVGEADEAAAQAVARKAPDVPVLAHRSLNEVASVLAVSRGYVGNDSGITHLAAALEIPVVALFGPTDAAVWGPRGAAVAILQANEPTREALAALSPADVLRALKQLMTGV